MLKKLIRYFTHDIWSLRLRSQKGPQAWWLAAARAAVLAGREFMRTQGQQRAAALTYLSLLSIVPVAALMFGIAKGFGVEELLERQLLQNLQGQQEAVVRIIQFARALIDNTRGGLVAGIGVAALLWTVVKMLGNIEAELNEIWGVQRARSLGRKFSDYLSAMLVCPLLLIISGSLTVTITAEAQLVVKKFPLFSAASPMIEAGLGLIPYVFMWALFSFLYIFMPNTKVRLVPGVLAGVLAGSVYQIMQWVYIKFQIGISGYNAVYGGFAALPLFLVWLQTSWTIVLLGAAVSKACQSVHSYDYDTGRSGASHAMKRLLAVRAVQAVVKDFESGQQPPTLDELAARLQAPQRLLGHLLASLVDCGVLATRANCSGTAACYQPAKSTASLTIAAVIDALDDYGGFPAHLARCAEADELCRRLAQFKSLVERSPENTALKDL